MTEAEKEALEKCAHAITAVDEWLGSASTAQYAKDALWRAARALQNAGIKVPMNTDGDHWRGSVFRALEKCGLGWTGYEDEIRFRALEQPNWTSPAGMKLQDFIKASFALLNYARGEVTETELQRGLRRKGVEADPQLKKLIGAVMGDPQ